MYGATIYTLYKSGIINEQQLIILNDMPQNPVNPDEVFDIIDEVFPKGEK
jgi:hypothetical protein